MRYALGLLALVLVSVIAGCALSHEIGVDANFDSGPRPATSLCAATGGTWRTGPCCPTTCGRECLERCFSQNCRCAADQIWDPTLGCVRSSTCE